MYDFYKDFIYDPDPTIVEYGNKFLVNASNEKPIKFPKETVF